MKYLKTYTILLLTLLMITGCKVFDKIKKASAEAQHAYFETKAQAQNLRGLTRAGLR